MLLNCGIVEDSGESFGMQEIKLVNPKGNQSGIFIGRTDAEAETPILWSPTVKTQVRSLGWEDPLEKEMATHSTTLAWKFSWMEKPGRLQSMGSQRVRRN